MKASLLWRIWCLSAGMAVLMGAFGAHALNEIDPHRLSIWQKAVFYQMTHSLMLVLFARSPQLAQAMRVAAICMLSGIIFFCGSLYSYVLLMFSWLPMFAPIGGLLFIIGWIVAAFSWKKELSDAS